MSVRNALRTVIALVAVVFINGWRQSGAGRSAPVDDRRGQPSPLQLAIGFVTNFFDTLGIGSFATTTALYKLLRVVSDDRLVGTLVVGHSLPVVAQAFIFLVAVQVDTLVLASLIGI